MKLAMGALLLTFITAVTAGFFVYQFMFSLTEKMKTAFPTQSLQVEPVNINSTCITVSAKNFASVNIQIREAYVNGTACSLTGNIVISPNNVGTIHLGGAYVKGETYMVTVVPSLGSPFTLSIRYD